MWSCGVIMYLLITGTHPFKGSTKEETLLAIKTAKISYTDPAWIKVSPEAQNLVSLLLDKNTQTRIKAHDALNHPWIVNKANDVDKAKLNPEIMVNSLRNLKNFKSFLVLQKSALTYIASHFSDPKEEQKLADLFNEIDKDKDGKVSKEELHEAYLKICKNEIMAKRDSSTAIKMNDFNGNGVIDYT